MGLWFLSYIESSQYDEANCLEEDAGVDVAASCHRRSARLHYEVPEECEAGTQAETALTIGANYPRLKSAVAANGAKLVFQYQRLPTRAPHTVVSGTRTHECVLASVDLVGRDGTVEPSVVTYQYADGAVPDAGVQSVAGLLAGAEWPDRDGGAAPDSKLEYAYQSGDAGVWEVRRNGVTIVHQMLGGDGGTVSEDYDGQASRAAGDRYTVTAQENGCWPGVFQPTGACRTQNQYFTTFARSIGDGDGYFAQLVTQKFTVQSTGSGPEGDQGPTVRGLVTTVQCGDQPCPGIEAPFNASSAEWYVGALDAGIIMGQRRGVEVATGELHSNGAHTVYDHELMPSGITPAYPGFLPSAELRTVYQGASGSDGTGALLKSEFKYLYGGAGRSAPMRAYEQQLEMVTTSSSFSDEDSSLKVETRRQYDPVTNRLNASIRTGYTWVFSTQTHNWSLEERSVGTFYLTRNVCSGQSVNDAQGRVRTVMGPCAVAEGNFTECAYRDLNEDLEADPVPIGVFDYWDSTAVGDRAGRLKSKSVYPNGCGSTPVVTYYDAYDARGRLLQTTDANGVVTRYEYKGTRLLKKIAAAGDAQLQAVTEYGYDDNATHGDYIKPEATPYEVLCYRKNTLPNEGCKGGELTTLLQWKAKSAWLTGATYTERVDYSYHLGRLRSETFRDATGQVRRTRYYQGDPLQRQTFEAWGAAGPSVGADTRYSQTSLFDRQGNRVGLGQPYQPTASDPEPFCGGFDPATLGTGMSRQPASPHCKAFAYDRLNRLVGLLEPVDSSSNTGEAAKMCVTYDNAGNLRSLRQGCPRGGNAGDCSLCGQPLLEYRHDDFGHVVRVDAPWGTGPQDAESGSAGRGRFQYEYDAAGNLIRKQTPTMAAAADPQWVENAYDQMKRLLKSEALKFEGGDNKRETLFEYFYDQAVTPPWGCPGFAPSKPSKAMGRAQVLTDSFGDSWYQYDSHGNIINIYRSRAQTGLSPRSGLCYDAVGPNNPSSARYYDSGGRLLSEMYPGGRLFSYTYYPGATGLSHRIESVDVVLFNGVSSTSNGWDSSIRIVEDIKWEPYGGLLSYVMIAPKAPVGAQKARVHYHTDGVNQPLSSCNSTAFAGGTDTTGRIFGLTVSTLDAGGTLGDILKRVYTWRGDQLLQEDTCMLETGNVPPTSIRYADATSGAPGYDARLQLKKAHRIANASATAGGSFESRAYAYDARGNRTLDVQDGWRFKGEYNSSGSPRVDLLMSRTLEGTQCGGSICPPRFTVTQRYNYDADGRVSQIATYKKESDSVSSPFYALTLDATTDKAHAAVGAVYRQVTDSEGRTYEYFYDAVGRRRLKRHWMSSPEMLLEDEYFYDGTRLVEDWGHTSFNLGTADSVHDEYIWLGDRPIGFFKVRISQAGQRVKDFEGDCPRNGEAAPCGLYFLVADGQGKPVLALDSYRRVTGVADYDPYGHVNRTTLVADSPVLGTGQNALMVTAQVPKSSALVSQVRARFPLLDVQGISGVYLADGSGVLLNDVNGQSSLLSNVTMAGAISSWVVPSSIGTVQVRYQSASTLGETQEAALGSVEYRRFQSGAAPVWTPLRFPGQYHDEETGFFENWNRFYDPSIGRYLAPEPMITRPGWLLEGGVAGRSAFIYAYAGNNPAGFTDPDGLRISYYNSKGKPISALSSVEDFMAMLTAMAVVDVLASSDDEVVAEAMVAMRDSPLYDVKVTLNVKKEGASSSNGTTDELQTGSDVLVASAALIFHAVGGQKLDSNGNPMFTPKGYKIWAGIPASMPGTFAHEMGHAASNFNRWRAGLPPSHGYDPKSGSMAVRFQGAYVGDPRAVPRVPYSGPMPKQWGHME